MKIQIILLVLSLLALNCNRNDNKKKVIQEEALIVYEEEVKGEVIINEEPLVILNKYIVDTFGIRDFVLATVKVEEEIYKENDTIRPGAYLTVLPSGIDLITDSVIFFNQLNTFYRIHEDFMDKNHFNDITNTLEMDSIVTFNYSFTSEPFISNNVILYIEGNKFKKLLYLAQWNESLKIRKINDSIFNIVYSDRDHFGYFHDDYLVEINKNQMMYKLITPRAQKTRGYPQILDTLTVYITKDDAVAERASIDSLVLNKGDFVYIDSIFWNLGIIKISNKDIKEGFVHMREIGYSIDISRAG